ncbi:MAG: nucleotide exchange factor GrpE [Thermomicrobiales bacterium]|nr:nucleotide exchange factor GrpE [Thermomicrobiales bacterium]
MTDARSDGAEPDEAVALEEQETEGENGDIAALTAERDQYLDQLQRTAAEYANYRRRNEQEREQLRLAANERLLRDVVPVLDDLQRGLEAIPEDEQGSAIAEGMRLVEQKLMNTLRRYGVTPIEAMGQPFDHTIHDAVEAEPGGDTVVAVYAPGYRLGEGVLRPAMVKVGRKPEGGSGAS